MSQPPPDARARGRELLAARARRATALRRRVVAATLATFVLAYGAVSFGGSTGTEATATAQVTTPSSSSATTTDPTTTTSSDSSSSDDSAASLTTSQS